METATLITDGWVSWATRRPGVADKVYSQMNSERGIVLHSIVGSYEGAMGRLLSTARDAAGMYTAYAAASVMFVLRYSGELVQMYPCTTSTWASGGREVNCSTWSVELEGGPPGNEREPIREEQIRSLMRLVTEFTTHTSLAAVVGQTILEHGSVAVKYGYAPTACPSGRYARFYEALASGQDDEMNDADKARVTALEAKVERIDRESVVLGPDGQGYSLLETGRGLETLIENAGGAIAEVAQEVAALRADVAALRAELAGARPIGNLKATIRGNLTFEE